MGSNLKRSIFSIMIFNVGLHYGNRKKEMAY